MNPSVDEKLAEVEEKETLEPLWEDDERYFEPQGPGIMTTIVAFVALGLGVVALLLFFFQRDRGPDPMAESVSQLEAKLASVEERAARMEGLKKEVSQILNEVGEFGATFSGRMDKVGKDVEALKQELAELGKKATPPPPQPTPKPTPKVEARFHTVARGETLYSISRSYGLNVNDLIRINDLDPGAPIYVGQRLRITPAGSG